MKKIVITGGAGFIGSHTTDFFLAQGWSVVVFDNFSSGKMASLNQDHAALVIVKEDILNYPKLAPVIADADAVLHLAALPSVPKSLENPIESLKINTLGFVNVLQAIRESKKNIRLVYASSAAVYGADAELPCNDDASLNYKVLSPYALEKVNNEHYADLYKRVFGLKSLALRYFNVYGSRQDPSSPYSGVISKFIDNYKNNQPIHIYGDGKQSRDFIHVSDVARANYLAINADYCGYANIATGQPQTLNNLVRCIEQAGNKSAKIIYRDARLGDIPHSYAATLKANTYLEFTASCHLEAGIQKLVYE